MRRQGVAYLQYTQEQAEMVKCAWKKKIAKRKEAEEKRRAEALQKAGEIAIFLKSSYEVGKIYLFGSLAWRERFTAHSDIDLYLENFPDDKSFWEALAKAEEIAIPFPVSIVLAENAHPGMRAKIEKEGIEL